MKHPFKTVEVSWLDSAASEAKWIGKKNLPVPVVIVTQGFLVFESDKHVCVAASYYEDGDSDFTFGEAISIPKCSVIAPRRYRL